MTARVPPAGAAADRLAELSTIHPGGRFAIVAITGDDGFHVELSLPDRIGDGRITDWAERIMLPVFPRDEVRLADGLASPDSAGDRGVVVEVSRL